MSPTRYPIAMILALTASRAGAWEPEEQGPIALPEGVRALGVLPGPLLVAGGWTGTRVLTPGGSLVAAFDVGAEDIAVADVDLDGRVELLLCGDGGLVAVEPETWTLDRVVDRPCEAVEVVVDPDLGPALAVGMGQLRLYVPSPAGLVDRGVRGNFVGRPRIAATADRWAYGDTARTHVEVFEASGRRELLAADPIGDLAAGPSGFVWTIPRSGELEDEHGTRWRLDGPPRRLVSGHMDLDDDREVIVVHADASVVSVVAGRGGGRAERFFVEGPSAVAAADLDGDRCDDLIVGFDRDPGLTILYTRPCRHDPVVAPGPSLPAVEAAPPDLTGAHGPIPLPHRPRTRRLFGIEVPSFLGRHNATAAERLRYQQYVVVGSGWAMGSTLHSVWFQIPFFPALAVELEGGGPHVRWFVGGDSAALFFWVTDDGGGIHLANLSAGVTFGSPRLRTGPYVTGGLLNAGAGLRTVFTPWADGWNTFKGVELRLTWFTPATGEVMLLYVWSQPTRRTDRRRREDTAPSDPLLPGWTPTGEAPRDGVVDGASPDGDVDYGPIGADTGRRTEVGPFGCRRFSAGLGAAFGGSSTRFSWEFVGSDVPIAFSASPALSLSCEGRSPRGGLFLSADTAPLFSYLTKNDERLHHMGSHTVGWMLGGDGFRIGPTVTAGIWVLGGGLRSAIRLRRGRDGVDHHLDLRATALWPSAPAGQILLLYGVSFDPWR